MKINYVMIILLIFLLGFLVDLDLGDIKFKNIYYTDHTEYLNSTSSKEHTESLNLTSSKEEAINYIKNLKDQSNEIYTEYKRFYDIIYTLKKSILDETNLRKIREVNQKIEDESDIKWVYFA